MRAFPIIAPALLGLAVASAPAQEESGGRDALLIGVKGYDPRELVSVPHAEADVNDLATALIRGGFDPIDVEVMTQARGAELTKYLPTAANIRPRLRLLTQARDKDDVIVVAFSGHGVQFRGEDKPYAGTRAGEERSNDNTLGMAFCWCPPTGPGGFRMGSPEGEPERNPFEDRLGKNYEGQVTVHLTRGFWMGKHEVTQAQWRQVTGDNPSSFSSGGDGRAEVQGMDTGAFPVENVSWRLAIAFCRKLTEREHAAGLLPRDWEYRLPTEAQWEYACRADTTTATAFGDTLSSRQANFDGDSPYNGASRGPDLGRTTAVGSFGANAWGFQDMHGNVWEWCLDEFQTKRPGGADPLVPPQGDAARRVLRGGSWLNDGRICRSAYRSGSVPTDRNPNFGFRLARVPRVQ